MNLEELLSKTLHPSWCNGNAQVHWSTFLHHPKLRRNIPVGQSLPFPLHYHHYNCCCILINIHDSSSFLFKPEVFMTPKWPWMWNPQWLRHWEKLEIMLKSFISPLTSLCCRQLQKTNLSHSLQQEMALCARWSEEETPREPVETQHEASMLSLFWGWEPALDVWKDFSFFTKDPTHPTYSPPTPHPNKWKFENVKSAKNPKNVVLWKTEFVASH